MKQNTHPNKYFLYENAVQTPAEHLHFFNLCAEQVLGKKPLLLREDFCGTFFLSSEWVKQSPRHQALALDIDPEPLSFGKKHHFDPLSPDQKQRLKILPKNVLSLTRPACDVIAACNFSFYALKSESLLYRYFDFARRSLSSNGMIILEMAGGPGFIETIKERKKIHRNQCDYTYVWDQIDFDPIQQNGKYAIHFKIESKDDEEKKEQWLRNCFTYDWRIWSIPEVRFWLSQAGFEETFVYWEEADDDGKGTDVYIPTDTGDNAYAWLCYVIGVKKRRR